MAQWVKDAALSLQRLGLLLWLGFSPWPRNLHVPGVSQNKTKSTPPHKPPNPNPKSSALNYCTGENESSPSDLGMWG